MLILSRKPGQGVVINENVEITVLEVRGDVVRLGIQAPRSVSVQRKEIYLQVIEENRQAMATGVDDMERVAQLRPPGGPSSARPRDVRLPSGNGSSLPEPSPVTAEEQPAEPEG